MTVMKAIKDPDKKFAWKWTGFGLTRHPEPLTNRERWLLYYSSISNGVWLLAVMLALVILTAFFNLDYIPPTSLLIPLCVLVGFAVVLALRFRFLQSKQPKLKFKFVGILIAGAVLLGGAVSAFSVSFAPSHYDPIPPGAKLLDENTYVISFKVKNTGSLGGLFRCSAGLLEPTKAENTAWQKSILVESSDITIYVKRGQTEAASVLVSVEPNMKVDPVSPFARCSVLD